MGSEQDSTYEETIINVRSFSWCWCFQKPINPRSASIIKIDPSWKDLGHVESRSGWSDRSHLKESFSSREHELKIRLATLRYKSRGKGRHRVTGDIDESLLPCWSVWSTLANLCSLPRSPHSALALAIQCWSERTYPTGRSRLSVDEHWSYLIHKCRADHHRCWWIWFETWERELTI